MTTIAEPTARIKRRIQETDGRRKERSTFHVYVKVQEGFDERGPYRWFVARDGIVFAEGSADVLLDAINWAEGLARKMEERGF